MLFGVTNTPASYVSSVGRSFTPYRTRLVLRIWSGGKVHPLPLRAVWDTAADFVTVRASEANVYGFAPVPPVETLQTVGVGGTVAGVLTRISFQIDPLRDVGFSADCLVLPDAALPVTLLGNLFIRRNFNVQTVGERRTYFRLRDPAPDAVPIARFRNP